MAVVSPQMPLALRYPPDQRFDTFVAVDPVAVSQLRDVAISPGPRGVFVSGASGTGKTHVLLSACAQADAAARRAAYLPLAAAASRLREALEAMHAFDLVALDGVEAVVGTRGRELALFDFHNRMHDAGRSVLYAAQMAVDGLEIALPDLRSRLQQCLRIALPALDDDGRREMLRLRAQRRGLQVDAAAYDWLLRRVDRDPASLAGLFDRLDKASLAAQRRVTVPFLRDVLG